MTTDNKHKRGFASMDPEKRRAISAAGGKKAQERGVAHRWTAETAAAAGRIGGLKHSKEHLRKIGRLGGLAPKHKKEQVSDE